MICNLVMIAGIVVICFCGYGMWKAAAETQRGEKAYRALRDEAVQMEIDIPEPEKETPPQEPKKIFDVDFDKLREINPDVIAWLRFEEPSQINYPVVKGPDNEKYLYRIFDGTYNTKGTLFVDVENNAEFADRNTFIYGHKMDDDSMFGRLHDYEDSSFCAAHPFFYLYTPDGREVTYQVFAVCEVKDTADNYIKYYDSDEEYQQYIDMIRSIALYPTEVQVTASSQIVSLSTCMDAFSDDRLLVHAVKVGERPNIAPAEG